jgi:hypothetical protein
MNDSVGLTAESLPVYNTSSSCSLTCDYSVYWEGSLWHFLFWASGGQQFRVSGSSLGLLGHYTYLSIAKPTTVNLERFVGVSLST